ncbi:hypothetical protein BOTNAR_0214g00060 [Botryotinia narcissicola]|uniref:Fungal lipase-type domain-containing protein n=1 Tax=Botryotinia narcissicola TaxID=278944 RepID=A0A4Z1I5E5_9HELO|nr:hypothetical protein BOTNAR_0214g00060 [Botryotinia narcissicola]
MPLLELNPGTSDWHDVKYAALILWRASQIPDPIALRSDLRNYDTISPSTIFNIHTGINQNRKAFIVKDQDIITVAFEGSTDDEILVNLWTDGKGPNWWDLPYPVYVDGNRVHSFYLDMWNGMKAAVFFTLDDIVTTMQDHNIVPKKLIIAGYSMGGGVSTLGFTSIVEHVRHTYGSQCSSPQDWASDDNLGSLIQHLTFASTGAGDMGYLTLLNEYYERYHIRAWDFLNHWDRTPRFPPYHFRNWRGHRYILPQEVTCNFEAEFGPMGHLIHGYYQSAEWMAKYGLDQVKTAYRSGYA